MDHAEKLEWAAKQLERFGDELAGFIEQHPFAVRKEVDHQAKRIRVRVDRTAPVPRHWPLAIGDVIHNTRCALDYIVWELSSRAPMPPNKVEMRTIQFPICMTHGEYFGTGPKRKGSKRAQRLRFVASGAQAVIDGLQPHLRGHSALDHPLAILNELANIDKHRKILLAPMFALTPHISFSGLGAPATSLANITTTPNRYEQDAELAVIEFPGGLPADPDMQVTPHPTGAVIFDLAGPARGFVVVEFLERLHDHIRSEIFDPLEALL